MSQEICVDIFYEDNTSVKYIYSKVLGMFTKFEKK